jgi:hypothetical protein
MYITFFTCYVHFPSQKLFFLFPSPFEKVPEGRMRSEGLGERSKTNDLSTLYYV